MIHAVFQGHAVFLALAVTVTLLAGVAAYFAVARRAGRARGVFCGLWASSVVGPLTLTTWSGSGVLTGECAINPTVLQAFAGVQGQLNVLLFVPFGVCAVLTTGRPFASLAAGVAGDATGPGRRGGCCRSGRLGLADGCSPGAYRTAHSGPGSRRRPGPSAQRRSRRGVSRSV